MDNNMLAELDEVVRLSSAATPGEWTAWDDVDGDYAKVEAAPDGPNIANMGRLGWSEARENAAYVAALHNFLRTHYTALADMAKRLEAAERDAARIEWLQQEVDEIGAFLLHNGAGKGSGFTGLGLKNTGRTLRQAVDACMPQPIIDATQEGEG